MAAARIAGAPAVRPRSPIRPANGDAAMGAARGEHRMGACRRPAAGCIRDIYPVEYRCCGRAGINNSGWIKGIEVAWVIPVDFVRWMPLDLVAFRDGHLPRTSRLARILESL
jgi:hypothetical protein